MVIFTTYTLLTGIAAVNLLSISLYAFITRERRRGLTAVFLSLFCLLVALNLIYDILMLNEITGNYLRYLDEFSLLLAFPCLYFYVVLLTNNQPEFPKSQLLHLLPALLFLLVWVFPPASFLAWNRSGWMNTFYAQMNLLQFMFYILILFRLLNKNDKVSRELISTVENGNLNWIKHLLIFLTAVVVAWVLDSAGLINGNLIAVPIVFFSYWLGYHTIHQKDIYYSLSPDFKIDSVAPNQNRYRNSRLTAADKKDYAAKIQDLMSREKPYLNNELTLTSMADKLGIKPIYLSQVLNEEFNENFYAFINRYRISESQRLLKDERYKNYSIQAIATEAGFNSTSTFNKSFREMTGTSPSLYQKE